jgi:hypothetical protein
MIAGYDNDHGITPPKKKFSGVRKTWGYRYQESIVNPYELLRILWRPASGCYRIGNRAGESLKVLPDLCSG